MHAQNSANFPVTGFVPLDPRFHPVQTIYYQQPMEMAPQLPILPQPQLTSVIVPIDLQALKEGIKAELTVSIMEQLKKEIKDSSSCLLKQQTTTVQQVKDEIKLLKSELTSSLEESQKKHSQIESEVQKIKEEIMIFKTITDKILSFDKPLSSRMVRESAFSKPTELENSSILDFQNFERELNTQLVETPTAVTSRVSKSPIPTQKGKAVLDFKKSNSKPRNPEVMAPIAEVLAESKRNPTPNKSLANISTNMKLQNHSIAPQHSAIETNPDDSILKFVTNLKTASALQQSESPIPTTNDTSVSPIPEKEIFIDKKGMVVDEKGQPIKNEAGENVKVSQNVLLGFFNDH